MVVKRGIKKKEYENLTPTSIERVISLLSNKPPITKKEACEILNISYNTARLNKIIEQYKNELEEDAKRRYANKGKPISDFEKQSIIEWMFEGDSVTAISSRLYRSMASINRAVEEIGFPEKSESYMKPTLLPEVCVSETFKPGQLVWVGLRNCIGVIMQIPASISKNTGENCYQVYEFERMEEDSPYFANCRAGDYAGQYGTHKASELGSLEHLKQYGVDLSKTYKPHFPRSLKIYLGMEVKN